MKTNNLKALLTAVQITPELKAGMLAHLTGDPAESETLRLLTGVLKLHNEETRDFLKYPDIQIINAFRMIYLFGTAPETAKAYAGRYSPALVILRTLRGNSNFIIAANIRHRETLEQLEEIKTILTGVHSIDPERVRIENRQSSETKRLDLIEKKDKLERRLKEYRIMINHADSVKEKLKEWDRTKAPEQVRDLIAAVNDYDMKEIDRLLDPYVNQIIKYSGMNG